MLNISFYQQPTLDLAQKLLGKELRHETTDGITSGLIVEVEAYLGPEDRAAHSFGGRRTKRTEVMFGAPGMTYLYLIYGLHLCFNIVSGPINKPEAILIRAIEPTHGMQIMSQRRFGRDHQSLRHRRVQQLTNGPGKLTEALGLSMNQYGHLLTKPPLYISDIGNNIQAKDIAYGPRINIDYAKEAQDYPYRFWINGNNYVSV